MAEHVLDTNILLQSPNAIFGFEDNTVVITGTTLQELDSKKNNEIRTNKEINAFIKKGNYNLGLLGYTDHSEIHCSIVAENAAMILEKFGYSEHEMKLARIAGYMHDIGNAINRLHHAEYGGLLANEILKRLDMPVDVVSAISNHD